MNQNEQIIYLYSNVSSASAQVKPLIERLISISKIPIKYLNVDSKEVKNMIKKSKEIKVKTVPSLILLSKIKNKVEVYEGEQFVSTIQKLIEAFTPPPPIQEEEQQNINQLPTQMKNGKTSLDDIFDPSEEDIVQTKTRQKFGKTKLNLNPDVSPFAEDGRMLIGNLNPPTRGEGHNDMKRSSIPEFGMMKDDFTNNNEEIIEMEQPMNNKKKVRFQTQDQGRTSLDDIQDDTEEVMDIVRQAPLSSRDLGSSNKKVPMKIGKKVEMIEDLSSIFDTNKDDENDNYGIEKTEIDVEVMRSSGGGNDSTRRDEKSKAMDGIKKEAERMMRDRELEGAQNRGRI
jgi:hypothetical protein